MLIINVYDYEVSIQISSVMIFICYCSKNDQSESLQDNMSVQCIHTCTPPYIAIGIAIFSYFYSKTYIMVTR